MRPDATAVRDGPYPRLFWPDQPEGVLVDLQFAFDLFGHRL
ncbi:hypothetical protein [Halorientalis regularis]|nr:hypothetical protein [Halorientalis regularis]